MPKANVTIHLEPGTPRTGIWCDTCHTSARYEVDVHAFGIGETWLITTIRRCARCEDDDE